jgi:hypothetical protein
MDITNLENTKIILKQKILYVYDYSSTFVEYHGPYVLEQGKKLANSLLKSTRQLVGYFYVSTYDYFVDSEIENAKVSTKNNNTKSESDNKQLIECGICMEKIINDKLIDLDCKHQICISCFNNLKSLLCPFCRNDFTNDFDNVIINQDNNSSIQILKKKKNNKIYVYF